MERQPSGKAGPRSCNPLGDGVIPSKPMGKGTGQGTSRRPIGAIVLGFNPRILARPMRQHRLKGQAVPDGGFPEALRPRPKRMLGMPITE